MRAAPLSRRRSWSAARCRAQEAARSVLEAQREIGSIGWFEIKAAWESYGESLASGDSAGEEGQRLLVAIAEKLKARFGC
jgi:hypothetical protein